MRFSCLRKPPNGPVSHSDRGSQYTRNGYRRLLKQLNCRVSMVDERAGRMPLWSAPLVV